MPGTMKGAVYAGPKTIENISRPIPIPREGETLIKVESVGICGTDIAIYSGETSKGKSAAYYGA